LVSKKLAGIRLVSVEFEIGRKTAAEGAKTPQELVTPGLTRNAEPPGVGDIDFNLIAFFELKRFDHGSRKPDRETVSPFGDLHVSLFFGYTLNKMYIQGRSSSRCVPCHPKSRKPRRLPVFF
jgi:hypothetical protein